MLDIVLGWQNLCLVMPTMSIFILRSAAIFYCSIEVWSIDSVELPSWFYTISSEYFGEPWAIACLANEYDRRNSTLKLLISYSHKKWESARETESPSQIAGAIGCDRITDELSEGRTIHWRFLRSCAKRATKRQSQKYKLPWAVKTLEIEWQALWITQAYSAESGSTSSVNYDPEEF